MYDFSIIVKFLLLFTYLKDSDGHLSIHVTKYDGSVENW